jgi:hypothetical protein
VDERWPQASLGPRAEQGRRHNATVRPQDGGHHEADRRRLGRAIPPTAGAGIVAPMLLGDDLLEWILLAMGGALLVGNVMALVRPPANRRDGDLDRAPVLRSVLYAAIGALAAIWALASLLVM